MADGLRYKDKVTLVTGGSSGIGEGCVSIFVRHGSKVVFCSNNESQGQDVEKKINKIGPGEATFIFADVTKEDDVKYALPHLRKTEGNIINNCSMEGHSASGYACTYATTKGAVIAMTKALAIDEAQYNVRVNSISPGSIATPLADEFINKTVNPEATRQQFRNLSVLGKQGTPEECGMTCLYLAADATFCTGVDIQLSGGSSLNYGMKNIHMFDAYPSCIMK